MAAAEVLRRSVLRAADFGADDMAVATTRHPDAPRRALARLRDDRRAVRDPRRPDRAAVVRARPEQAGAAGTEFRRFAVAPSLDERLARLPALTSVQREGE